MLLIEFMSSGRAVWGVVLDRLESDTVGSNPAYGMDVWPRLFIIIINIHLSPYRGLCIM
jgi:hypothetical protein